MKFLKILMWQGTENEDAASIRRICKTSSQPKRERDLKTQPYRKNCARLQILGSRFELYQVSLWR